MKPELDLKLAESFVGKHLLVGVTYLDKNENVKEQKQFHGIISRINDSEGVVIASLESGEEFFLPPDLRNITEAHPGEYRLRSTGEVVVNPDLLAQWTCYLEDEAPLDSK